MLTTRNKLTLWASQYLSNFSLSQVYAFATLVVLLFTIIFASLLIQNEYQDYEKQLTSEYENFVREQELSLIRSSTQLAALMSYELQHPSTHTDEALKQIEKLFTDDENSFIQLFDRYDKALFRSTGVLQKLGKISALEDASLIRLQELEHTKTHDALVYVLKLANGYTLISGLYTKPANTLLMERHDKQKSKIVKIVLEIATLAFILFGVIFGINKIISAIMQRDVDTFLLFFEQAAHNDQVINYKQIFFKEFRMMVRYANEMVETIMYQKLSLAQLNASLEQKVEDKTVALQKNYEALQKAQHFSQTLLDSQKQFLRHAVHETNTPLSVIMTNIELFTMQHGKNRQLAKIDAAVKNIFNIYDDLSYLVKKDQVEYPRIPIDINAYLQSRKEFFEEVAEQSRLSFVFEPCEGEHFIYFNETKLQRIIDNNITNAIKYTLPNEVITMKTTIEGTSVCFEIYSRSKKIENINKVLEPYYQEDGKVEGFGLGLNLVKSICEEEGVALSIDSSEDVTRFSYIFKVMGN